MEKEEQVKSPKARKGNEKKKLKRRIYAIASLLVLLGVVLGIAFLTMPGSKKTVVTVNGEPISQQELDLQYDRLPEQYKSLLPKEAFLDEMIRIKLLLQEAKKQGIAVTNDEVAQQIAEIKDKVSKEAFSQLLQERKLTEKDLELQMKDQLVIGRLLNQTILSKLSIPDERIEAYYRDNPNEFTAGPGEIQVSHILVKSKESADSLLEEINAGTDFHELAEIYSLDGASAKHGGRIGFISKGKMDKTFEEKAFSLKEGEVSSVIETPFGFQLIRREADSLTFTDAKELIKERLLLETLGTALETFVNQLRSNSVITYSNRPTPTGEKEPLYGSSFRDSGEGVCKDDGKAVIRLYTASGCKGCPLAAKSFEEVLKGFVGKIQFRHWELNTGDNLATPETEKGVPQRELGMFKKLDRDGKVPFSIIGCKYYRAGNFFATATEESKELAAVISSVVG
ncbi:peptidylprolyl isomerase [Candidatus Woesearchaeota archaeon]|nr:peptidylprolyl isomerase [Candidatus Woesearchaeota archaeon]